MDAGRVFKLGSPVEGYLVTLTVLMAVHDAPVEMLELAIDSILSQTFSGFEFLILDDGSRSEEVRACLARRAGEDQRIRIAWEPHRGLTPTLNLGLSRARGEFIARQDADDWSEPTRLARQMVYLHAHPETVVCGCEVWKHQRDGTRLWRSRLPRTHGEILSAFWQGNPFVHGSVIFERKAALAIGGYREDFPCSQDYDFFWRLAETREAVNLSEALYHYRYVGGSVSAERAEEQARSHGAARRLAAARRRGEQEDIAAALAAESGVMAQNGGGFHAVLKQADHLMLAGEYGSSWRAYTRLLRTHPASPVIWAKLLRYGVFLALPPAREVSFR